MKTYILGNWKMAQSLAGAKTFFEWWKVYSEKFFKNSAANSIEVGIFPSFVHLPLASQYSGYLLGGQDCAQHEQGAYTGDVSAQSLQEVGAEMVLIGHSERRQYHFETNESLSKKLECAERAHLLPVFCIGETDSEREAGKVFDVLESQLQPLRNLNNDAFVIAYEPVWAIGTGKTASKAEIGEVHDWIQNRFPKTSILYGGSVKPENAREILRISSVRGLLIGGASLKKESFESILQCALECVD